MARWGILLFGTAVCLSCSIGNQWRYRTMPVEGGYGYIVLERQDTLIYQPYIPAIEEQRPFPTEKAARKVAAYICRKLAVDQPPTLSKEEVELLLRGQ